MEGGGEKVTLSMRNVFFLGVHPVFLAYLYL